MQMKSYVAIFCNLKCILIGKDKIVYVYEENKEMFTESSLII